MTTEEKIVVSAYTGYLMCDFDLMQICWSWREIK